MRRRRRGAAASDSGAPASISPIEEFHGTHYLRHNQRRQEHLASLNLPLAGRTVIEVGAGIGDHTTFFLDRNCSVLTSDGRPQNVAILSERYPHIAVRLLDLDDPDASLPETAEIVYCYALQYVLLQGASRAPVVGHTALPLELQPGSANLVPVQLLRESGITCDLSSLRSPSPRPRPRCSILSPTAASSEPTRCT